MLHRVFIIVAVLLACHLHTAQVVALSGSDIVGAVEKNDMNTLTAILSDKSNDVDAKAPNGWTGLLQAARQQNEEAVKLLLRAGARTYIAEVDGWTALHFAAALGNVPICNLLINAGADILRQNNNGVTPQSLAAAKDALVPMFKAAMEQHGRDYGKGAEQYQAYMAQKNQPQQQQAQPQQAAEQQRQQQAAEQQRQQQAAEQQRQQQAAEQQRQQQAAEQQRQQQAAEQQAAAQAQAQAAERQKAAAAAAAAAQPKVFDYDRMFDLARAADLQAFKAVLAEHAAARAAPFDWSKRSPRGFTTLLFALSAANAPPEQQFAFAKYVLDLRAAGEQGIDLNAAENDGWTVLMFAAFSKNSKLVSLLLDAGASALPRNKRGSAAYEIAAQMGQRDVAMKIGAKGVLELLRYSLTDAGRDDRKLPEQLHHVIINSKCDANIVVPSPDHTGITALMLSVIHDSTGQVVESLVTKCGADLFARDAHGWSVPMYAIAAQQLNALNVLIRLSGNDAARLLAAGSDGESPTSVAQETGNKEIIAVVSKHAGAGAVAAAAANSKKPRLGSAYQGKRARGTSASRGTSGSGSSVNVVPNRHAQELMDAATKNNIALVRSLIADGGDIHWASKGGFSALHAAVSKGFAEITRLLVDSGANVNLPENDGWTPLMFAGYTGRVDLVDLLLDAGANPLAVNKARRTAYELAIANGHKQVGAKVASEAILNAIRIDDVMLIQALLRAGANPSSYDNESGRTPLMALVKNAAAPPEMVDAFMNEFSFVDVNIADRDGNTALFLAVQRGDLGILATLIAHGADTTRRNRAGLTPLEMARLRLSGASTQEVVKLLERFPNAASMQKALEALRRIRSDQNSRLSMKDAAHALSEPTLHPDLMKHGDGGLVEVSGAGVGGAGGGKTMAAPNKHNGDSKDEAEELRRKNAELTRNLEHIAAKARQEYSTKAKDRALQEKAHKERVIEEERRKKEQGGKSFFAKLFGW